MSEEKPPRWPTVLLAAIAVAIAAAAIAVAVSAWPRAESAPWRLDPSFAPQASSTEIPIIVSERACSSGRLATDRMEVDIAYSTSAVAIGVKVKPLGGDQDCQGVETPYVVQLRERLGERELVDPNARTP